MSIFINILMNNVMPIMIVIVIGVILHRSFKLDIRTLSKMNFFLFSPVMVFKLLNETNISAVLFGQVILFCFLFFALQYAVTEVVIRLRRYEGGKRGAVRNSVFFYNSGNYGLPINQLAFAANPYTLSIQVIVMVMQALIPYTYGIYSVNAHKAEWRKIVLLIIKMPIIYVIPIALMLHSFEIPIPNSFSIPIDYIADAFIGIALLTLGAQLANMEKSLNRKMLLDVGIASTLRLIVGPLLAAGIVWMMGLDPLTSAALIVSSAVPTSLSSVLLAVEYDNEQQFSSQMVLVTTIASVFTLTVIIYMLQMS
ncbi:MAG: AEC family transporter [Candidatus Cohnella colombiensis]|uniref:AEC family transporter n=1 Tax=Candidatus Cohnella colombiensis TaxID=3121368 RepID=A0AA95JDZ5_9BACL|nr:MAG: AEC family transporter [Cohnella sp.]